MKTKIQAVLDQYKQKNKDSRNHVFNLEILGLEADQLLLKGEILERLTLKELMEEITGFCPELHIDLHQVKVLRKPQPEYLWVATNLTSFHAEPSWLAEMLSQLLYGTRVEVLKTEGNWVFARQDDGYLGWAYRPYLSSTSAFTPTHLLEAPVAGLFEATDKTSKHLSRLYAGTHVAIYETQGEWVRLLSHAESAPSAMPGGWMQMDKLIALDRTPKTPTEKRNAIVEAAFRMYGVPYLWGGCTTNGIDCSGLAQLCHKFAGLDILRDADLQKTAGKRVEYPYLAGDLIFFGDEDDLSRITHVGISLGGWEIIHSSRSRNGVYVDDIQAVSHLQASYVGGCSYIAQ